MSREALRDLHLLRRDVCANLAELSAIREDLEHSIRQLELVRMLLT